MSQPTVLNLIHSRLADPSSQPGQRSDPYTLAMVLEGGGNAGAISGAVATALQLSNALRIFDEIRGNSAGLMVGAYFAAGNVHVGTTIFPELNCDERFINPKRLLSRNPIMNLGFCIEDCFTIHRPLLWENLQASRIPVWAVSVNRQGQTCYLPLHGKTIPEIQQAMYATSRVPFVAQGWNTRAHNQLDGMLTSSIPLTVPPGGDGWNAPLTATHAVVMRTSPAGSWTFARSDWEQKILPLLGWVDKDLATLMRNRMTPNQQTLDILRGNTGQYLILGLEKPEIHSSTRHAPSIWKAMAEAYLKTFTQLGLPAQPYPANWQAGFRYMTPNPH